MQFLQPFPFPSFSYPALCDALWLIHCRPGGLWYHWPIRMPAPPPPQPFLPPPQLRRENLRILFCSVLQKGLSATELREFFFLSLFQKTGQEKHNACGWRHLILSSYFFSFDGFFICISRTFYYGDSGTRKKYLLHQQSFRQLLPNTRQVCVGPIFAMLPIYWLLRCMGFEPGELPEKQRD